jgi:hypothetical protein
MVPRGSPSARVILPPMRFNFRLPFALLSAIAIAGCPAGDDDDVAAPDDDDAADSCEVDTDCSRFDNGLEICDLSAGMCVHGDRNNSRDESQLLSYESTAQLYVAPAGDVDWFRFNGAEGDLLLISTEATQPDDLDTVIIYHDQQGNQIGFNDDFDRVGSVPPDSRLYVGVPDAGTFYISIQDRRSWANDPADPPEGGADFQYSITLAQAGSSSNVPAISEPNDSASEATDWPVDSYSTNYTIGGTLETDGDEDWIRVPVVVGEVLRLYGFPNTGTQARPSVRVMMPDTTTPIRTYTALTWATDDRGYVPVLETGDYYLQVTDENGNGGFDHWYFLHAAKNEPEEDFRAEVEPNDSIPEDLGFASGVTANTTIWGRIGSAGDEDHYGFTAASGDRLTVRFERSEFGETTNPVVTVVDSLGVELTSAAWTGDDDSPAISLETLPSAGQWTVIITEADPAVGHGGKLYVATISIVPGG